jgi:hypothetical protein
LPWRASARALPPAALMLLVLISRLVNALLLEKVLGMSV